MEPIRPIWKSKFRLCRAIYSNQFCEVLFMSDGSVNVESQNLIARQTLDNYGFTWNKHSSDVVSRHGTRSKSITNSRSRIDDHRSNASFPSHLFPDLHLHVGKQRELKPSHGQETQHRFQHLPNVRLCISWLA